MSAAFQSAVAQLVVDRRSRSRARDGDAPTGLTIGEVDALRRLASDPGLLVTAKLVASFRLGKVLSMLPMTREALGNEQLADELDEFWLEHPPTSFYAPDEVIAFCDFLEQRLSSGALVAPELGLIIAFERAQIATGR